MRILCHQIIFVLAVGLVLMLSTAHAHRGRTNSSGCHNVTATGGYHCHNSGSAKKYTVPPRRSYQKKHKRHVTRSAQPSSLVLEDSTTKIHPDLDVSLYFPVHVKKIYSDGKIRIKDIIRQRTTNIYLYGVTASTSSEIQSCINGILRGARLHLNILEDGAILFVDGLPLNQLLVEKQCMNVDPNTCKKSFCEDWLQLSVLED